MNKTHPYAFLAMLSYDILSNELTHGEGLVGVVGGVQKGLKSKPEVVRPGTEGI